MPRPWTTNDTVQVKVGTLWLNAIVSEVKSTDKYECVITTNPLPTLTEAGLPVVGYVPGTTQIQSIVLVSDIPHLFDEPNIRDPI